MQKKRELTNTKGTNRQSSLTSLTIHFVIEDDQFNHRDYGLYIYYIQ
jgi:hypothetical protein